MTISVVIRSRCQRGEVLRLLEALANQSTPPGETVAIDSGSAPEIVARLRQWANGAPGNALVEIPAPEYQSARALNTAIAKTTGELVAIVSQDAHPARTFLESLAMCFDNPEVAGAYGRQVPPAKCDPLVAKDLLRTYPPRSRLQRAPDCWFVNTCSMIRRTLWERHPFQEWAVISEDHEWARWAQREGRVIAYCAEAVVDHAHEARGLWARHWAEGLGLGAIHRRAPSLVSTARTCLREVASDAVWLTRTGRPHWIPVSILRRGIKSAALHAGMRRGSAGR